MRRPILVLVLCVLPLSSQTKKILVDGNPALAAELQSASPNAKVIAVTPQTVMREIADADAYIGSIRPEQVRAGKKLKWVQIMSAGVENVLFKSGTTDLRDSKIVLTNNKIVQGPEIADHALAMLLMLTRGLNVTLETNTNRYGKPGRSPASNCAARRRSCLAWAASATRSRHAPGHSA